MTDAGLKELAPLTNLTTLRLHNTKVTDAGLKELAALTNLTELDLEGSRVTAPSGATSSTEYPLFSAPEPSIIATSVQ